MTGSGLKIAEFGGGRKRSGDGWREEWRVGWMGGVCGAAGALLETGERSVSHWQPTYMYIL